MHFIKFTKTLKNWLSSMNNNIIGIIEARMGSSRFPGKVLTPINGIPALERMVKRISKCKLLDDFIVATSVNKSDDQLADWLKTKGVKFHRGSEDDVFEAIVSYLFVMWVRERIQPRSKKSVQAKPQSSLNPLLGVRRMLFWRKSVRNANRWRNN